MNFTKHHCLLVCTFFTQKCLKFFFLNKKNVFSKIWWSMWKFYKILFFWTHTQTHKRFLLFSGFGRKFLRRALNLEATWHLRCKKSQSDNRRGHEMKTSVLSHSFKPDPAFGTFFCYKCPELNGNNTRWNSSRGGWLKKMETTNLSETRNCGSICDWT